jgi:hypothetical protein
MASTSCTSKQRMFARKPVFVTQHLHDCTHDPNTPMVGTSLFGSCNTCSKQMLYCQLNRDAPVTTSSSSSVNGVHPIPTRHSLRKILAHHTSTKKKKKKSAITPHPVPQSFSLTSTHGCITLDAPSLRRRPHHLRPLRPHTSPRRLAVRCLSACIETTAA